MNELSANHYKGGYKDIVMHILEQTKVTCKNAKLKYKSIYNVYTSTSEYTGKAHSLEKTQPEKSATEDLFDAATIWAGIYEITNRHYSDEEVAAFPLSKKSIKLIQAFRNTLIRYLGVFTI